MFIRNPTRAWDSTALTLLKSVDRSKWTLAVVLAAHQVLPMIDALAVLPDLRRASDLYHRGIDLLRSASDREEVDAWMCEYQTLIDALENSPHFVPMSTEYSPKYRAVCVFLSAVSQAIGRREYQLDISPVHVLYSVIEIHRSVVFVDPMYRRGMNTREIEGLPFQIALSDWWLAVFHEELDCFEAEALAKEFGRQFLRHLTQR